MICAFTVNVCADFQKIADDAQKRIEQDKLEKEKAEQEEKQQN